MGYDSKPYENQGEYSTDHVDDPNLDRAPIASNTRIPREATSPSPTLTAFYAHHPIAITCDSGATSSLIRLSCAQKLGIPIQPTHHCANQADGKTSIEACGEINVTVTRDSFSLQLQAVVVKDLDCEILAGVPFMKVNNIVLDLPGEAIVISNKRISYSPAQSDLQSAKIRRSQAFVPRPTRKDETVAMEHRYDRCEDILIQRKKQKAVDGFTRIPNLSSASINKHQHLIQGYMRMTSDKLDTSPTDLDTAHISSVLPKSTHRYSTSSEAQSSLIKIDPDNKLDMGFPDSEQHKELVDNVGNKSTSTPPIPTGSDSDCSDIEIVPTLRTQNIEIQNPMPPLQANESSSSASKISDHDTQNEYDLAANTDTEDIHREDILPKPPDPIEPTQATVRRHPHLTRKPPEYLDDFELNLDTLFKE
jgi:hypothetical protein